MPRPLAKMSDDEFLRYLRQSRGGKGKTLAEVFENEAEALERRCIVLTLANVLRMLERPIDVRRCPTLFRVFAYVDASRIPEFKKLTGAHEREGRLVVETGFTAGPSGMIFTPKEEIGMPFVWWNLVYANRSEYPAIGLTLTFTKARDAETWNTHRIDHLVWQASSSLTWVRGPIKQAIGAWTDGEPRAVIAVHPHFGATCTPPMPGNPPRWMAATPWGVLTANTEREADEIVSHARDYGTFSIEVPVTVPSLGE